MRRLIIFPIIVLSFILFPSCVREKIVDSGILSDSRMGNPRVEFGGMQTKCAESHGETYLGESIIVTEDGDTLYISAYLSDMEDYIDAVSVKADSKSTLINSSNFGTATGYTSFSLDVYKDGESVIYQSEDKAKAKTSMQGVTISYTGGSTDYKWSFDKDYFWPNDGKGLNFLSYGPSSEFGTDGSASNLAWNKDTGTFSFHYTTPTAESDSLAAQCQKDIIVGVNHQTFSRAAANNNVVLSLKHPLMAVRFVLGDIYGKIEFVSLENFYSEGNLNAASDTLFWSDVSVQKTFIQLFDEFDATKYTDAQKASGTIEIDQTTEKSRNFIIIPQQLPANAAIGLKLGNNLHPITLIFDKIFGDGLTKDWRKYAGKVLTFRLSSIKANLISVDIKDDIIDGTIKNNIQIFNDGKSDLYIRAVLVGNWLNSKGNILASWDESFPYGKFDDKNPLTDLTAFPNVLPSDWVLHTDGFYYYRKIVPSGYKISNNLFNKFELTDMPTVENSDDPDVQLANFEMSILVQAVAAVDPNGLTRDDPGWDPKYSARKAWGIDNSLLTTDVDNSSKM